MNNHTVFTKGRTAVITGGASGIGLAAAKAASQAGMSVVLIDLPGDKLNAAAQELNVTAIGADVSDAAAMQSAAARVARELPPVTFLMNNAGIGPGSSAAQSSPAWAKSSASISGVSSMARRPLRRR